MKVFLHTNWKVKFSVEDEARELLSNVKQFDKLHAVFLLGPLGSIFFEIFFVGTG